MACTCNGRADVCNTTTGACVDCQNNTAGAHCDVCAAGFFGDISRGDVCQGTSALWAQFTNTIMYSCRHVAQWESCGYMYNVHCLYVRALCLLTDCNCTSVPGSTGDCDSETGACRCLPNVIGARCDQCDVNTYNDSTGPGCLPCGCHPIGAVSSACDVVRLKLLF